MLRTTIILVVLSLLSVAAAEEIRLRLAKGETFALRASMDTEVVILMGEREMEIRSEFREDLGFEVLGVNDEGVVRLAVRYARAQGVFTMPMVDPTEFDSDVERPTLDEDALAGALMLLVGLEIEALVSPLGEVLDLPEGEKLLDAHLDRYFAEMGETDQETIDSVLETIMIDDLRDRIEFDLQRFGTDDARTGWPMALRIPGQEEDKQMVMKGTHRRHDEKESTYLHEGELEFLRGVDDENLGVMQIRESSVEGATTVDPKTGLVQRRRIEAHAQLGIAAEPGVEIIQTMTFTVEPVELTENPIAEDEDDPFADK